MTIHNRLSAIAVLVGAATLATQSRAAEHPSLLFDASEIPSFRARLDGPLKPDPTKSVV